MRILLLSLLCFASFQMYAQRLDNIRAQAINGGESVVITYDLKASEGQKFKVAVYSSHNNYTAPLTQVSGDLVDVTAGTNKQINWNARTEMVEYSGDVIFELRADLTSLPPLTVKTPSSAKRGKPLTISYSGVSAGETVKLELIKGGVVVNQIGNTTDPSKYTWAVPMDVTKGGDYQVRMTAGARTATSGSFPVKSKTKPVVYIVAGAVVVTGVVVLLVSGKNGGDAKDLPTPPDPAN